MKNCLEIKDLCKSYGNFALDHVNLTIPGGTIMGLIGENGAGKTTTIKCILNLIRRDSGTITILGKDNVADERAAKLEVGVVLDECFFHDSLRPKDLKRILGPVYPTWDDNLYADYLKKFKLPEGKLIKEFSRGMKMKLSLAAALAHQPRLLILDEATAGLDPVVRDEILDEFLSFICDEDHAILISSHITSDLEKAADYITYLRDGEVIFTGGKEEFVDLFRLVKGGREELSPRLRERVLGLRTFPTGFEGLMRTQDVGEFPGLYAEPASIHQIVVFTNKGGDFDA